MRPDRAPLRTDLQGLRGLGVLLIVVGHLFLWPHGVFAALDIFFVLSGFVITELLVRSFDAHGRRFLPVFYLARARRLLPMAVLVLAVTVVGTYVAYSGARASLVGEDALYALFFAVNWHFAADGTDYFAMQAASPLQHYWSLSVEEQFYVVWPALLLLGLAIAAKRASRPEPVLAVVMGLVVAGSFGYSLWHSTAAPTSAYFSTFDRAWEFGAGGLLALAAPKLVSLARNVRLGLTVAGLAGVFVGIFVMDPTMPFPAPWGLVPVAVTVAIIIGGLGDDAPKVHLLDNPVMVYVGNMSYSVYLWHMPVNELLAAYVEEETTAYYVAALALTAALSVISYHLVERPLRHAPFLMLPAERRSRPPRPLLEPAVTRVVRPLRGWLIIGVPLLALYVGITVMRGGGDAVSDPAADPAAAAPDHRAALAAALRGSGFPDFDPSLEDLANLDWGEFAEAAGCLDTDLDNLEACSYGSGDAERTVAVVGDSFAVAWMPTILEAFETRGWRVQQLTLSQCPTWTLDSYIMRNGSSFPECLERQAFVETYVAEEQPDLVILSSSYDQILHTTRAEIEDDGITLARDGLGLTLDRVLGAGADVVVLGTPPPHANLLECVTRSGGPPDCASTHHDYSLQHIAGETEAAAAAGVPYIDTTEWFCVDGSCPGFVGTTPVTVDGVHLSVAFAEQLAPLLVAALPDTL